MNFNELKTVFLLFFCPVKDLTVQLRKSLKESLKQKPSSWPWADGSEEDGTKIPPHKRDATIVFTTIG